MFDLTLEESTEEYNEKVDEYNRFVAEAKRSLRCPVCGRKMLHRFDDGNYFACLKCGIEIVVLSNVNNEYNLLEYEEVE